LPDFRPGQHLLVRPATAGAFQATRCYSLSSAPDSRYWRITVKRQALPTRTEPTKNSGLSLWLHDHIRAGDCLLIGGPCGHFYLPTDCQTEPLVLLAAGVGVTPMASMLRWSMENTPERPVVLLYQAKDVEHWPLGTTLHQWLESFPNCRVVSYFSRLTSDELHEKVDPNFECRSGKLTVQDALQALPLANCRYYMCGPEPWMDQLRNGLVASGIRAEHVHWESFGGGAPTIAMGEAGSAVGLQVRFDRSGIETQWNTTGQSIWELARENDVEIPSGCLSGVCGSCRVRLIQGEVAYDRKIAIELAKNECLACVAQPRTNICIDA
jgi:ferredoxin-NADP reductase